MQVKMLKKVRKWAHMSKKHVPAERTRYTGQDNFTLVATRYSTEEDSPPIEVYDDDVIENPEIFNDVVDHGNDITDGPKDLTTGEDMVAIKKDETDEISVIDTSLITEIDNTVNKLHNDKLVDENKNQISANQENHVNNLSFEEQETLDFLNSVVDDALINYTEEEFDENLYQGNSREDGNILKSDEVTYNKMKIDNEIKLAKETDYKTIIGDSSLEEESSQTDNWSLGLRSNSSGLFKTKNTDNIYLPEAPPRHEYTSEDEVLDQDEFCVSPDLPVPDYPEDDEDVMRKDQIENSSRVILPGLDEQKPSVENETLGVSNSDVTNGQIAPAIEDKRKINLGKSRGTSFLAKESPLRVKVKTEQVVSSQEVTKSSPEKDDDNKNEDKCLNEDSSHLKYENVSLEKKQSHSSVETNDNYQEQSTVDNVNKKQNNIAGQIAHTNSNNNTIIISENKQNNLKTNRNNNNPASNPVTMTKFSKLLISDNNNNNSQQYKGPRITSFKSVDNDFTYMSKTKPVNRLVKRFETLSGTS